MDVMKNVTFYVFISHERHKLIRDIFIVITGVSLPNFVGVTFLLTSLQKVYFLHQRFQHFQFFRAEITVLLILGITVPASRRI